MNSFSRPTMRDMPAAERPRERLIRHGAERLSNEELLAVLISRGTAGAPVREIAEQLIRDFGSIAAIGDASLNELARVRGIGPAKACQLVAAFELGRRARDARNEKRSRETATPEAVVHMVRPMIDSRRKECFITVLLDARDRIVGVDRVSIGSLDTTLAHPREVFNRPVRDGAAAVIVVHNHPSGDPTPSDDDIRLTRRLSEAGRVLGIGLRDHIILTESSYYSFRRHALL